MSDWKGMKEMGAEKWGCNARGEPAVHAVVMQPCSACCPTCCACPGVPAACFPFMRRLLCSFLPPAERISTPGCAGFRHQLTRCALVSTEPQVFALGPFCAGDAWRETWRETIAFDEANAQPVVERTAHKWAKAAKVGTHKLTLCLAPRFAVSPVPRFFQSLSCKNRMPHVLSGYRSFHVRSLSPTNRVVTLQGNEREGGGAKSTGFMH